MKESINYKTLVRNLIIGIIFGIVFPYIIQFIFNLLDSNINDILNTELIIANGIVFCIVYTAYGIFNKDTFIRFIIGIVFIVVQIYFFTVGSNPFTFYLPHCAFGQFCLTATILDASFNVQFNYAWILYIYFSIKILNLIRHYLKREDTQEKKEEEYKIITFDKD